MAMSGPPSGRRGRNRAPMADINVTPLVDVMLVLLIIFMVTAPLLVTGVPVNLPETRAKGLDQDAKPTGKPDAPQIFLRADTALDYGRVMRVMGELNRAGLNKVALVSTGGQDGADDVSAGSE